MHRPARARRTGAGRVLVAADAAAFALAAVLADAVAQGSRPAGGNGTAAALCLLLVLVGVAVAAALGLYGDDELHPGHGTVDELGRLLQLVTFVAWTALIAAWASGAGSPIGTAVLFWLVALAAICGGRFAVRLVTVRSRPLRQKCLIVGAGEVGQLVCRKLVSHSELGVDVVGFVDDSPRTMRGDLENVHVLGTLDDLPGIVRRFGVNRVVVAFSIGGELELRDLVRSLRSLDVHVDIVPRLFEAVGPAGCLNTVEGLPLLSLPANRPSWAARAVKRCADAAMAAILLALLSPLFAWIAWRIMRDSPGPVLFRQQRLTVGQRPFTLLKFRTMTVGAGDAPHREYVRQIMDTGALPPNGSLYKLARAQDVTRVGAWLRRTSLDELPQLVNVLRGEMSLVGPRPCIPYETELYEPHHFDRFLVPGGMTGLWQVAARAHSTLKEALDLDAAYARNWSLRLDLWLLLRTPLALLRGSETA